MGKSLAILRLICAVAAIVLTMQSCEKSEGYEKGGDAITWQQIETQSVLAAASSVEFAFMTREAWTASSDDPAMLTIRTASSGDKGRNNMTVSVSENTTGKERTAHIIITVEGYEPEVLLTVTQSYTNHSDYKTNQQSDAYLSEYYLWNDEYNSLSRDLSQDYDDFVFNTLFSMKTNTEDGGTYSDGTRYLYSFIDRSPSSRSVLPKTAEVSFGFVNLTLLKFSNVEGVFGFAVQGVYPDSPAARAGIVRGDIIAQWNDANITASNYVDVFYTLLSPAAADKASFKLNVENAKTITLTAESINLNPVLHAEVIGRGESKIGYLVYSDFEASFDDELLTEIRKFKAEGITDMVLDLRINGGGHVISAQMLSSIIAGERGNGKDCLRYEYNKSRMQKMGYSYPDNMESLKFGPDAAPNGQISIYSKSDYLSLSRLYVLVSGSTASASELTFTALRGIDFPVTLIGLRTEGKNVGMEPKTFSEDGYDYEFYPITFKYYNAKNETCDPAGTQPNHLVDDWNGGYADWGGEDDPMLAKAIELITQETKEAAVESRAAGYANRMEIVSAPKFRNPHRRGGLIAPAREN